MLDKTIKQFRYYNDNKSMNYPKDLTKSKICGIINIENPEGYSIFHNKAIYQLGIQALPGTKFFVNGSTNPAIVGANGFFEIGEHTDFLVNDLVFDEVSIDLIASNPSALLIIDTIEEVE